jgi:hypothetical protein
MSMEKLPDQWMEYIIVPFYKKGDKIDCCNYLWILLISTAYNILSNILLSKVSPQINEIIDFYQCGFQCKRSTTGHLGGKYCAIFL